MGPIHPVCYTKFQSSVLNIREVKRLKGKREFVPGDEVSPILVVYCSLLLHIN